MNVLDLDVPGFEKLHIVHLVLDYNGTPAVDGIPRPGALALLSELSDLLRVHVVTADTHGSVRVHLRDEDISLHVLGEGDHSQQKRDFVVGLGAANTIAIGNGYNDHLMLKEAVIGIAILQEEGLSTRTLINADLVCSSIEDALACLRSPMRLVASLRR